ncbi:MAG: DUF1385 domain-containing protein [bacterium]
MSDNKPTYGGQAVIEGVMIRGRRKVATAVRHANGEIEIKREDVTSVADNNWFLKLAFVRGTPALIDSMKLGYRTLMWSSDVAMEGEQQEKPSSWQYALTIIVAVLIGIGGFGMAPTLLVNLIEKLTGMTVLPYAGENWLQQLIPSAAAIVPNLVEGLIRLIMLVGYILVISLSKDITRVFQYHGAEHKVVNAWEAGITDITVENARTYSRIHPRCGTSFLFLFLFVGIVVHAMIGFPHDKILRLISRLVLIPVIAGIAYELIRLSGKFRNAILMKLLIWPGLLMQRITTAEPDDKQIEVAMAAMTAVVADEESLGKLTVEN